MPTKDERLLQECYQAVLEAASTNEADAIFQTRLDKLAAQKDALGVVPFTDPTLAQSLSKVYGKPVPDSWYIASEEGRRIVLLDLGKIKLPFYCSTGENPKQGVYPGKWYPFFGVIHWFNKGSSKEIARYYGSETLKKKCEQLDTILGDIRYDSLPLTNLYLVPKVSDAIRKQINADLNPVYSSSGDEEAFAANIRNALSKIPDVQWCLFAYNPTDLKVPQVRCTISAILGRRRFAEWGEDYKKFMADAQFRVAKNGDQWFVEHIADAKNMTKANGKPLTTPLEITSKVIVTLGNTDKCPIGLRKWI